jgi:hypothetical protein
MRPPSATHRRPWTRRNTMDLLCFWAVLSAIVTVVALCRAIPRVGDVLGMIAGLSLLAVLLLAFVCGVWTAVAGWLTEESRAQRRRRDRTKPGREPPEMRSSPPAGKYPLSQRKLWPLRRPPVAP